MLRALFAAVALVLAAAAPAAAAPPPLQAYGRLPAIENVEISPTGERLAYVAVEGETRRLVIQQVDGRVLASLGVGLHKVRDLQWAGPEYVLIGVSQTDSLPWGVERAEQYNVLAYNVKNRSMATLLDPSTFRGGLGTRVTRGERVLRWVLGRPVPGVHDGKAVAYVRGFTLEGDGSFDLFRVDLNTGEPKLHRRGSARTRDWLVRSNGEVVGREDFDQKTGRWSLLLRDGAGLRELKSDKGDLDAPSLLGLGRDGRSILLSTLIDGDRRLVEMGPGGELSAPLLPEVRPAGLLFDDATGRLLGVSHIGAVRDYRFFEPKLESAWRSVKAGFKGRQVTLQSWTPDFGKLVILVEGDDDSGTYYLVDAVSRQASVISEAYPQVPPDQVAPQRAVSYKAADGLEIPAYLTLPRGRDPKGLPLVVLPHGGPESRDEPGFDWWAQALASRGYAVLQPNFRGSSGYGRAFVQASYGQWGRKMQTDLSDGVRWLAAQGTVDPKRVCIVGASYGGYAALAGAALEPDVYRCAAAVAGVSDLPRMMFEEAGGGASTNNAAVRYWSRSMGAAYRDRNKLAEISPARLADRVKGPILLIHGKDDTVVPYEQSTLMARALERAGKPYELVPLAGEDHWLSREATRLRMLGETVRFLEKHNPPG